MPSVQSSIDSIRTVESEEDGYLLRYRVWQQTERPRGTCFLLNGMMSHSGWFAGVAQKLAKTDIKVVGADRRGSGLNEQARGDAPSRRVLLSDLRSIIEEESIGLTYLVGWCFGAVLAVNAALELNGIVSGVALLAPGLFPSELINRRVQVGLETSKSFDAASCFLQGPITPEMFTDRPEVREFIANDAHAVRLFTPRFFAVSRHMLLVATTRLVTLKQRVLLLLAERDETVDNGRTVKAFQQLPAGVLTLAVLNCHHGIQFETPEKIVEHLAAWA